MRKRITSIVAGTGVLLLFIANVVFAEGKFHAGVSLVGNDGLRRGIRDTLEKGFYGDALKIYYGEDNYDPNLIDLVIFIRANDTVSAALVKNGERIDYLYGEQKLWVAIFSEKNYPAKKDSQTTRLSDTSQIGKSAKQQAFSGGLRIQRQTLKRLQGPSSETIIDMVQAVLGGVVGVKPGSPQDTKALNDSEITDSLVFFGNDMDSVKKYPLYTGTKEFDLELDAYNRIVVSPNQLSSSTFRHIDAVFLNDEDTYFSSSIGIGVSNDPKKVFVHNPQPSFLILGQFNFTHLRQPISANTYAFAYGVSAKKPGSSIEVDFFLGLRTSLSNYWSGFSDGGLLIGIVLGSSSALMPSIGIDMRL